MTISINFQPMSLNGRLIPILQRYHEVSVRGVGLMAEHCRTIELKAYDLVSEQGRSDTDEYFIGEGVLHRYVIDAEGGEVTTAFHLSGMVMTPNFSRTVQGRSMFNIQALTPSLVIAMPVKELDRLRYEHNELRMFGLAVVQQELIGSIRQGVAFRERSARERLIAFRKEYPGLENLVSHGIIASYLGVTPVSLSRLRKELAHSN
jgi:CRP-like cAMP-binding protein